MFLILRNIKRDIIINVLTSSCKLPLIFVRFNESLTFSTDFGRTLVCHFSWKTFQWDPISIWRDVRRDMTKLIVAFRNFSNAPRKVFSVLHSRRLLRHACIEIFSTSHAPYSEPLRSHTIKERINVRIMWDNCRYECSLSSFQTELSVSLHSWGVTRQAHETRQAI
jgi:hypothetical protein